MFTLPQLVLKPPAVALPERRVSRDGPVAPATIRNMAVSIATILWYSVVIAGLASSLMSSVYLAWTEHSDTLWDFQALRAQETVMAWHLYSTYGILCGIVTYRLCRWGGAWCVRVQWHKAVSGAWENYGPTLQWACSWGVAGSFILQSIAATVLYFAPGFLPHAYVVCTHQGASWGLLVSVALSLSTALRSARLRKTMITLHPANRGRQWLALTMAALAVLAVYSFDHATLPILTVARVYQAPLVDGEPEDFVWQQARAVKIHTYGGANLPGGEAMVKVRGVYDGERLFMLFEWQDRTRSQKHLPLLKTAKGWKIIESGLDAQDENRYSQDQLGVVFATDRSALLSGHTPSSTKPSTLELPDRFPATRRLLYLWQWQSVRTGALGHLETQTVPAAALTATQRFAQASQEGFLANWSRIAGSPLVLPRRLPSDLHTIQRRLGLVNLDPRIGDNGQWWMALEETVPYAPELDTYPLGTVLPSVLIETAEEASDAIGTWKNGWWRLEISHQLAGQGALPVQSGLQFWVTVFDHSQNRPGRHLRPVRLALESRGRATPSAFP